MGVVMCAAVGPPIHPPTHTHTYTHSHTHTHTQALATEKDGTIKVTAEVCVLPCQCSVL